MAFLPPTQGKYKVVIVVGAVFVGLLTLGAVFGDRGVIDLQRLRGEQQRLEDVAFQRQQDNARLREHIERSRTDERYLEKMARQKLRWAKAGEAVYRFPDAPTRDSRSTAPLPVDSQPPR